MPRKAFVADLKQAIQGPLPPHISGLQVGDEDGSFTFTHTPPGEESAAVAIQALVPEVSDYPSEHTFMVFTSSGHVPKAVEEAISNAAFGGICVATLLSKLGCLLDRVTSGTQGHPIDLDDDGDEVIDGDSPTPPEDLPDDDEVMSVDYDDGFGHIDGATQSSQQASAPRERLSIAAQAARLSQLRHDLKRAKDVGFRATFLGDHTDLSQSCFVLISCRVTKLGIEDDALKAWGLERHEYITLLLYYTEGYKSQNDLSAASTREPKHGLLFHVGVTQNYKVSISEALEAFSSLDTKSSNKKASGGESTPKSQAVRALFVGLPMNELLNKRLLKLVEYRMTLGMPWSGAEAFYNDYQSMTIRSEQVDFTPYLEPSDSSRNQTLPDLMKQDEVDTLGAQKSFPLIAMQFTLRHVVRCTDFCLVCHRRTGTDFEALKPFVCSNPLCLYQYMQLGFGPSIEYEIMTQPYVVDLLISFAWASAQNFGMKDLPLGMNLMVPPVNKMPDFQKGTEYANYGYRPPRTDNDPASPKPKQSDGTPLMLARFNEQESELVVELEVKLKIGTWLVICFEGRERQHRQVVASSDASHFHLGPAVVAPAQKADRNAARDGFLDDPLSAHASGYSRRYSQVPTKQPAPQTSKPDPKKAGIAGPQDVQIAIYDHRFDDFDRNSQQDALRLVLETLPSVVDMKSYLEAQGDKHMSLRSWSERISPTALNLLRWIIASNRSCILQIDKPDGDSTPSEDRVWGADGYLQFRFAQGAPDKEQRFIDSVRQTTQRLNLKFPTIFVWHGSPLHNWHGIIREGLNFDKTSHGRAFGHGVYFSKHFQTSCGYSGAGVYRGAYPGTAGFGSWPSSVLKVSSALCLNEVVNAPNEFVDRSTHLVVKQLDWIQTRYLFVACETSKDAVTGAPKQSAQAPPRRILDQDPHNTSVGPTNQRLLIPITAISKSRRPVATPVKSKSGSKKLKLSPDSSKDTAELDDEPVSDATDDEDLALWKEKAVVPKTDFLPGKLDFATLPLLPSPSYATAQASRALLGELNAIRKLQDATPLHELGWYLDVDHVENMYQWIVEVHSFDAALPLAADLKARGLTAVVLELRFGASYPHSPPFVRVVRPRFRPFGHGGGGHVTSGGALCMELLTNSGWNVTSTLEAVLLQVRLAMASTEPHPARLDGAPGAPVRPYGAQEAMDAYRRACLLHNWEIPQDFQSPGFQVADDGAPAGSFIPMGSRGPAGALARAGYQAVSYNAASF